MLGVALPLWLTSAMLAGFMSRGRLTRGVPSLEHLVASFIFLYAMWAIPALAIAAIHQLVLAVLPRDWSARATRLVILATSLGIGAVIVGYAIKLVHQQPSELALTLILPAVAYGMLDQPLRQSPVVEHHRS
jgi:hypothetical protein